MECFLQNGAKLRALPEHQGALDALAADAKVADQLDTLVGTPFSGHRVDLESVPYSLMWLYVEEREDVSFDADVFARVLKVVDDDFAATELTHTYVAPIPGLRAEVMPIVFEKDLEIAELDDETMTHALSNGLLPTHRDFGPATVPGVVARYHLPKVIGEASPKQLDMAAGRQQAAVYAVEDLFMAMRLLKEDRISTPATFHRHSHWTGAEGSSWSERVESFSPFDSYSLNQGESEELKLLWASLHVHSVRNDKALQAAIRRMSFASNRRRLEDRLVDLMIAAESLFLFDADAPAERGELRFRLALRGSFFLARRGLDKRSTFRHLRDSYDARSAIVHGGELPELRQPGGGVWETGKFVDRTDELLRLAIREFIVLREEQQPFNWNDLVLGS